MWGPEYRLSRSVAPISIFFLLNVSKAKGILADCIGWFRVVWATRLVLPAEALWVYFGVWPWHMAPHPGTPRDYEELGSVLDGCTKSLGRWSGGEITDHHLDTCPPRLIV